MKTMFKIVIMNILMITTITGCKKKTEDIDVKKSSSEASKLSILTGGSWRIIFHQNGTRKCSDGSNHYTNFSNVYSDASHLLIFNTDGTGKQDGEDMTYTYNESTDEISIKDNNNSNTYNGKVLKIEENDLRIDIDVSDIYCPNSATAYGYNVYNCDKL